MFNCITYLDDLFSHNLLYLNMSKIDTIILDRPSYPINDSSFSNIVSYFQSISTLGFTINSHLEYSAHINNRVCPSSYFLYNIRKSYYKLTYIMNKYVIHLKVFIRLI